MSGLLVRLLMSCDEVTFCDELTRPMDFRPLPLDEFEAVNPRPTVIQDTCVQRIIDDFIS